MVMGKHTQSDFSKYSTSLINANFPLVLLYGCYVLFGMCAILIEKAVLIGSVDTVHDSVSVFYPPLIFNIFIKPSIQPILQK